MALSDPTSVVSRKRALRLEMVPRILSTTPEHRASEQKRLLAAFPELPGLSSAQTVLLYASAFPEEIATDAMIRLCLARGQRVVCPKVDRKEQRLRLFPIVDPDHDFVAGVLRIPEPRTDRPEVHAAEIDWVLVPGLAFDLLGYRLGRGAGHYDRLIGRLRPDVACWALAWDSQIVDSLPTEPHDQPVDGVVTPSRQIRGVRHARPS
jgi:5-formyltetrahydrofolate cyclo-ligase